jgi:CRISPR-associated protein Cas5t
MKITILFSWLSRQQKNLKKFEGEEYVRFYAGNWLMASACVGVLKVLENAGEDIEKYAGRENSKNTKKLVGRTT